MTHTTAARVHSGTSTGGDPAAPLDLNLLRTFLAVYRAGSFTAAAPRLGLSQPTVTAQIRTLEQQAGRDLFVRLPRGVEPSAFAHELVAVAADPLDRLAAIDAHADVAELRRAPVHLAGPSELLCTRVLPALAPLVAEGLQLRVVQGQTDSLLEQMRTGAHDLIISSRRPRGRALISGTLFDEEYVAVAAPRWANRLDLPLTSKDVGALGHIPLVAFAEDLPIVRRYWREVFGRKLDASAAITVPNLYAVLSAVVAGAGYSVLPLSLCRDHLDDGRLLALADPPEPPLNTFYLSQRPGADTNPDVAMVWESLTSSARRWG